jgi:hypothetical protein
VSNPSPYEGLPSSAFWRSGVAEESPFSVAGIYRKKFDITPTDKIATAGSCFAQHIGRFLRRNGYSVMDVEPAPAWMGEDLRARHGYGVYSARYGNIYTVAQLAQLALECTGAFSPRETVWRRGDRFVDAMRPAMEPEGFESPEELLLHRRFHLERVRSLFASMDVFVFTLGLTEAWFAADSDCCFPTAPGTVGGEFDPEKYVFRNLTYGDITKSFAQFFSALRKLRGSQLPRVILTVSPVPLTATASGRHVLAATTYSKAVLRAVAGDAANANDFIDYFPSYEIVTNPAAHGAFFDSNLRTVRRAGVETVMKTFFEAHPPAVAAPGASAAAVPAANDADAEDPLACEEALLEAFAK